MSPSFDDAFSALKKAQGEFEQARLAATPELRDPHMRIAFSDIYEATRIANMLYFNVRRKGITEGGLLTWAKTEFEDFTSTLYMQYFNRGAYSKADFELEYTRWSGRARDYINKLASEVKLEQIITPVHAVTDGNLNRPVMNTNSLNEGLQDKDKYETSGTVYIVPTMTGNRGLIGMKFHDYQKLLALDIKDEEVTLGIRKAKYGNEYSQQIPEYKTQVGLYTITVDGMPKPQLELSIRDVEELKKRGFNDMEEVSISIGKLPYRVPKQPTASSEFKLDL
ncbi:hypothetical protein LPY66_02900 [Dehalobacter sp. DCM]|uniref:hypothetical protein n=1 Tax=Dehalobacter sp. DCM TaxID=2907827 RepID=UPI003081CCE2|nr:hypothetical protein LPY66_02900 [Dehalobacter sp. DCM]